MDLECIMLSEISETRKKKNVWSYLYWICEILKKKSQANRDKIDWCTCQRQGVGGRQTGWGSQKIQASSYKVM